MPTVRARGDIARAICDRCGFKFGHNELIDERRRFKVCEDCYDPIPEQLHWQPTVRSGLDWTRPEIPVDETD